jgi:hypothetical protein
MKLPFTIEEFLKVFERYNLAVWPMQIILYLLALIAIYLAIKKIAFSDKIIIIILSFFWMWMGIVYHLIYFTSINKAAFIFGSIFILQGIIIFYQGVFKNKLSFQFHTNIYGITGSLLIIFALLIYPLIGYSFGHQYPSSPTFGLPCPTTIFTFGFFLWTDKKFPLMIIIIPLLWSIIGFSAAFFLGIKEDLSLLTSGLVTTLVIVIRNKRLKEIL